MSADGIHNGPVPVGETMSADGIHNGPVPVGVNCFSVYISCPQSKRRLGESRAMRRKDGKGETECSCLYQKNIATSNKNNNDSRKFPNPVPVSSREISIPCIQ